MDVPPPASRTPIPIAATRGAVARRHGQALSVPRNGERYDSADVSSHGRRIARLASLARGVRGDRSHLIARLRAAIDAGAYRVEHEALAEEMLAQNDL